MSPEIASFHGIRIRMFVADHDPPHIHAWHAGDEAKVGFAADAPYILDGALSPAIERHVLRWVREHRLALLLRWAQCQRRQTPARIGEEES